MANRPVFVSKTEGKDFVDIINVDFLWYPGFAIVQKQKSIKSLHSSFKKRMPDLKILEISSKSENGLGVALSAFNLSMVTKKNKLKISVESAFQGSKVFSTGGPFDELYYKPSKKAKKDGRLKTSGRLICFDFFGQKWPLEPKTLFYDWIYLNALKQNENLIPDLLHYDAFTDIEFNPEKSINCQAYSAALFCSLHKRGIFEKTLKTKNEYIKVMKNAKNVFQQLNLFS